MSKVVASVCKFVKITSELLFKSISELVFVFFGQLVFVQMSSIVLNQSVSYIVRINRHNHNKNKW